jgi:hypothetical protein
VQNKLNNQQKQGTTRQKNSEQNATRTAQKTILLTEKTSTPKKTEQVSLEENEEKNVDNDADTQIMIENFQRQEQMKTTSLTLKNDTTNEFQGNNQNGQFTERKKVFYET